LFAANALEEAARQCQRRSALPDCEAIIVIFGFQIDTKFRGLLRNSPV